MPLTALKKPDPSRVPGSFRVSDSECRVSGHTPAADEFRTSPQTEHDAIDSIEEPGPFEAARGAHARDENPVREVPLSVLRMA
jgi:hypothetical protein